MRRGHKRRLPQRETKLTPSVILNGTEGGRQVLNAPLLDLVLGLGIGEGDGGDQALFAVNGVAL